MSCGWWKRILMIRVIAGHPCHIFPGRLHSVASLGSFMHSHLRAAAPPQSGSDLGYHLSPFSPESPSAYSLELWTEDQLEKKFLFFRKIIFRIIILNVTNFYNFYYEIYHEGQRAYIVNTCSLKINNKMNSHVPTTSLKK